MRSTSEPASAPLSPIARVYFAVVGAIGLLTGAVLLVAPAGTAQYFAWPIVPPQTALFMGAGYLGTGITLFILLLLGRSWADVRLILPPVAVFASAMIGATLLHADRFLWDRPVTWLWVGLYAVVLVGAALVVRAHRMSSSPGVALTPGERLALAVVGAATAACAVPLYVAPGATAGIWPWMLTPLTARVVAGWVAVAATLALVGGHWNDARALRLPLLGWNITVAAFFVTSALSVPLTGEPRLVVYFVSLAASVAGSLFLLLRVQRRLAASSPHGGPS